ncbi:uncharacterized protein EI90DRAFT_1681059 [Cantharellus anzutake]|uniref:uncharacterized protein n=1 Tax=Cantharellus anzutake TaxID=1750568 RepID=UPI0019080CE1|nr:uncharacterized protein EI90DRAFT_1681059 [Cantharellus anzutake]KAF8327767.1 hypothetical protein EI90DRAFT_1681059 [Cantharellus anzutake]
MPKYPNHDAPLQQRQVHPLHPVVQHHPRSFPGILYEKLQLLVVCCSIGALRHLDQGNDWIKFPSKDWIKAAAKVMGSGTKEVTKNVTHEFLSLCNVRKAVDLSNEATWGHSTSGTESLLQPSPQPNLPPRPTLIPQRTLMPQPQLTVPQNPLSQSPPSIIYGGTSHPVSQPTYQEPNYHGPQAIYRVNGMKVMDLPITDSPRSMSSTLPPLMETHSEHGPDHPPPITVPRGLGIADLDAVVSHEFLLQSPPQPNPLPHPTSVPRPTYMPQPRPTLSMPQPQLTLPLSQSPPGTTYNYGYGGTPRQYPSPLI